MNEDDKFMDLLGGFLPGDEEDTDVDGSVAESDGGHAEEAVEEMEDAQEDA